MPELTARNVMIGLGMLLIVASVLADIVGLGQEARFGWKQGIALAVGAGLVVGGILWRSASR